MTDDEWRAAQEEWTSASNWRWGIYAAPRDPRIWVRKQEMRFGWTFNFAHPASWLLFACLLGGPLAAAVAWRWLR